MATIVYGEPAEHINFGNTRQGQEPLYGAQTVTVRWTVDNAGNAPGEAMMYVSPAADQVTASRWELVPAGGSTTLEASYSIPDGVGLTSLWAFVVDRGLGEIIGRHRFSTTVSKRASDLQVNEASIQISVS